MDLSSWIAVGKVEVLGWAAQILLIAWLQFRPSARLGSPRISASCCLVVICGGWIWRLAHLFALASGGFLWFVEDDALRWLNANAWGREPFLLLPDDSWIAGGYYLHGLAIWALGDPFYSGKFLACLYSVLPLIGIFLFAQAVFRNRLLSALCVAFAAPLWIHVLLGSGVMTELPVVGLLLAGSAALLVGLRQPVGAPRRRWLRAGSAGLALATAFHVVAWIDAAAIQACLAVHAMRRRDVPSAARLREWLTGAAISGGFCAFWLAALWVYTGSPLTQARNEVALWLFKLGGPTKLTEEIHLALDPLSTAIYAASAAALLVLAGGLLVRFAPAGAFVRWRAAFSDDRVARFATAAAAVSLASVLAAAWRWQSAGSPLRFADFDRFRVDLAVYPAAVLYSLRDALPLLAYGIVHPFLRRSPAQAPVRGVLLAIATVLGVLIGTALLGGANLTPYRSVAPICAALVPFLLAPAFVSSPGYVAGSEPRLTAGLLAMLLAFHAVDGHQKVFENRRVSTTIPLRDLPSMVDPLGEADVAAVGAWFRDATLTGGLSEANRRHRLRIALPGDGRHWFEWLFLEYAIGDTDWIETRRRPIEDSIDPSAVADELESGQLLLSDRDLERPSLREIVQIGHYRVYEATGGGESRPYAAPSAIQRDAGSE